MRPGTRPERMKSNSDTVLGELAVTQGLITRTELEACVEAQGLAGGTRALPDILLEMQLVTRDQLARLQQIQGQTPAARRGPAPESDLFGRLAISKGYATADQVEEALGEQSQLADAGQDLKLGQIMVRKRFITPPQFIEILKLQEQVEQGTSAPTAPARPPSGPSPVARRPAAPPSADTSDQTVRRPTLDEEIRGTTSRRASTRGSSRNLRPGARAEENFGRYQLLGKVGRGRLGVVHKALDVPLNRTVALKMVRAGEIPAETLQRFLRQAKIAARLNHPGIITIHEVGTIDSCSYFTMEFIEGTTLDRLAADRSGDRRKGLEVVEKAARALDYAHTSGVLHGCLTPSQVLVDKQGQPHITDFGMADPSDLLDRGAGAYLAPELLDGGAAPDAKADLYALGAILYEVLTGERPFPASDPAELREQISAGLTTTPRQADPRIPVALEQACLKALDPDPAARPESAAAFADEIRRHIKGPGGTQRAGSFSGLVSRRKGLVAALLLLLAAGGVGAWWFRGWRERSTQAELAKQARLRRESAEPHYLGARAAAERFVRDLRTLPVVELGPAAESVLRRLGECLAADPKYPEAVALRIRMLSAMGRWTDAGAEAEKALAEFPGAPPIVFEAARLRWREATLLAGAPLAVSGPAGEILAFPATASAAATRAREAALAGFREYLKSVPPGEEKPADVEERLVSRAVLALVDSRSEEALDLATDLQRSPGMLRDEGALLRSLAYASMKRAEDALREFDQAARQRSPLASASAPNGITPFTVPELERAVETFARDDDAGAQVRLGVLRLLLGDAAAARQALERAAGGGNADAVERLAWLEIAEEKLEAATRRVSEFPTTEAEAGRAALLKSALEQLRHLRTGTSGAAAYAAAEEAVRRLPRHPLALVLLGRGQLARNLPTDPDDALKSASDALRILVSYPAAYDLRAAAKVQLKDWLGVTDDLRKCRDIWPRYLPSFRTAASQHFNERRFDLARKEADLGLKIRPDDPPLLSWLARALFEMQDFPGAEDAIRRLQALQPANPEPVHLRVLVLFRSGRAEEGRQEIERLVKDWPEWYSGWVLRGQVRREGRDFEGAKQDFEKALAVAPAAAQPQIRRHLEDLARASGPEWLRLMRQAQAMIGRAADTSSYPEIHKVYVEAFRDYEKNPPREVAEQVRAEIMLAHYNHGCTWSVLSKGAGGKAAEFEGRALAHLEEALRLGFGKHPSGPHPGFDKNHNGLEHISHDSDFDPIRGKAEFKALIEKYAKEKEEF